MTPASKTVASTMVTLAQVVEPTDANFLGKAFGGALLSRIDLCAYATSSQFAETVCVTASFDRVDFLEPIELGEIVTTVGHVSYVGRTSIEVTIEVFAQHVLTSVKRHTNTARVTMVALKDGKPCPVPRLTCETREENLAFLAGKLRRERRGIIREEFEAILTNFAAQSDAQLDELVAAERITGIAQR